MNIENFFKEIVSLKSLIVLTGSGVSNESGIPTFRGEDGLWKNFRPYELATPAAFERNPKIVWEWYNYRREIILKSKPNLAHYGIKKLEGLMKEFLLITQNVDNLHRDVGSEKMIEIHGNIFRTRCTRCGKINFEKKVYDEKEIPPVCSDCKGLLRPDVVWFGESLNEELLSIAFNFAKKTEGILVVGTSGIVYPAAYLPFIVKEKGGKVFEINIEKTPITEIADLIILRKCNEIFSYFS